VLYAISFYGVTEKKIILKRCSCLEIIILNVQILVDNSYKKIFSQYIQHGLDSKIRSRTGIKSRTVTFIQMGGTVLAILFFFSVSIGMKSQK
jgi:hypothetical protein